MDPSTPPPDGPKIEPEMAAYLGELGMFVVAENSGRWFDKALEQVAKLRGWEGTGEDLRIALVPIIGEPHKPNAWGALINSAIKSGYLTRTGERRKMRTRKSHARTTDVYVSAE
jgi:hypothetical protein